MMHVLTLFSFEVTPTIGEVLKMGFDRSLVKNAVNRKRRTGGRYLTHGMQSEHLGKSVKPVQASDVLCG